MWYNDWWCRRSEAEKETNLATCHGLTLVSNTHTPSQSLYVLQGSRQWFIYIEPVTQDRVLISMQNVPKTSNGSLWGGREGSHIKAINQRHNFGSTWVIFHLNQVAKHLAFNTPLTPLPPPSPPISLLHTPQCHWQHPFQRGAWCSRFSFTAQPDLLTEFQLLEGSLNPVTLSRFPSMCMCTLKAVDVLQTVVDDILWRYSDWCILQ